MLRRKIFAAALLMLAGLQAAPAAAGSGSANQVYTVSVATSSIAVLSNGTSYVDVAPFGPITADVFVGIKTRGRIKSFRAWLTVGTRAREELGLAWDAFKEFGHAETFPRGERPKGISPRLTMTIPANGYRTMVLEQCRGLANRLRNEGRTDEEIFGEDQVIELGIRAQLQYDSRPNGIVFDSFGFSDNELDWEDIKKISLVCQRTPGIEEIQAPPRRDPEPPFVRQASLTLLEQPGLTGDLCEINLSGVIETSEPDITVKFRYMDDAGNQSRIHSVETDHAGIAMFDHSYEVPIDQDGPETGQVRIVGVSHVFESTKQIYEMNCNGPSFQALLPPTVEIDVVPFDKVEIGQQVCYSKVKLYARVEAQNAEMSGLGAFVGDYYVSQPQAYDIDAGEMVLLGGERELDWTSDPGSFEAVAPEPPDQPKQQTIEIGFNLTNANNIVVVSVPRKPYTVKCYYPSPNAAVLGGESGLAAPTRPQSNAGPQAAPQFVLATPLPDLKVKRSKPGKNSNRLRVVVINDGAAAAGASRLKSIYRHNGENVVRSVPVRPLAPGAKVTVVIDFGLPVKQARRIDLKLDAAGQVKESNEKNNRHRFGG